jgi:hypothetical protein
MIRTSCGVVVSIDSVRLASTILDSHYPGATIARLSFLRESPQAGHHRRLTEQTPVRGFHFPYLAEAS